MAKAYITEYAEPMQFEAESLAVGKEPGIAYQQVSFTTSTQSSAFNAKTKFIRVHVDAICSFKISSNPTAVTTESRMAASTTEYFAVNPGDIIAFVTNT
jgi:hypothetical protein